MKINKFLTDNLEIICIGATVSFIAYLTFPSILQLIFPEVKPLLWNSPLTLPQTVSIIVGIVIVGAALALTKHISTWRTSEEVNLIPVWLTAAAVFMMSAVALSMVAYIGFKLTREVLLHLGSPSFVALLGAVIVGLFITKALSR